MEEEFSINELSFKPTSNFMGQEEQGITAKMIHISIKQRSTRKCLTIIEGIPDDIDLKKVVKAWKNMFNCMGSIKLDAKTSEEYIELSGDHREEVLQFLLYEGIATKDNVTKHGAEI